MGVVVPASKFGKLKTVSQYVAITILILERGVPPEYVPFHLISEVALWGALALTVVSGADYFYRFFLKAGPRAIIKDPERWP
jgi:CDP-diacylglycerol--glycerol-3-phosphate 3-phosphatidyltransferase